MAKCDSDLDNLIKDLENDSKKINELNNDLKNKRQIETKKVNKMTDEERLQYMIQNEKENNEFIKQKNLKSSSIKKV